MPTTLKSLRLWIVVLVVSVTGLAAMALGQEPPAQTVLAWSTLSAI